jgi:hypothetical protein
MNFNISKNLAEHLGPACGTLVFRGTVVGNHCFKLKHFFVKIFSKNFCWISFHYHKNERNKTSDNQTNSRNKEDER